MGLRHLAAAALLLIASCQPEPVLPPEGFGPATRATLGDSAILPPEQQISNLDIATIRVAGPKTDISSRAASNHQPSGLILLVRGADLFYSRERNELACEIFFALMQVPTTNVIGPDERVTWWLDRRDPPPTTSNCVDLVANYDYYRSFELISRLNLTTLGQGPILVKQAADNAPASSPGAWLIDASPLSDEYLVELGKSWVSVVGNQDDPEFVANAIASLENPNANADAAIFWSVFGALWNWIIVHEETLAKDLIAVVKGPIV